MEELEYLGTERRHTPRVLQDIRKHTLNKAKFSDSEAQGSGHITASDANSTPHSLASPTPCLCLSSTVKTLDSSNINSYTFAQF